MRHESSRENHYLYCGLQDDKVLLFQVGPAVGVW